MLTVILALMGTSPGFFGVNGGILPLPRVSNPTSILDFHVIEALCEVLLNFMLSLTPLQKTFFEIPVTLGVGFTVTVNGKVGFVHPVPPLTVTLTSAVW